MIQICGFFCQEEENISHLLYFCVHVKPIWEIVNNVILPGEFISHDMVMFGYETDSVINHLISIIVYFVYREWLVCSFENRQRQQQACLKSLVNYLTIRRNVYSKCSHKIWVDVCIRLNCLISYIEYEYE